MAHSTNMQVRYDALVTEMKRRHGVRINKWRQSMSGCAWTVEYTDGTVSRLIEAPYPRGPMSAAVFLHEVGHHAIGVHAIKPRCLEELKAWEWSLRTLADCGLNVTPAVRKRMHESLHYAIGKARRRGLRRLPAELQPYLRPWSESPMVMTTGAAIVRKAATPTVPKKKKLRWPRFFEQLRLWG